MPTLSVPLWQLVSVLLAVMSVFLFVLMGLDKGKARRGARRIAEKHHGKLTIDYPDEHTFRATVEL